MNWKEPRRVLCGLVVQHDESFDQFNRLVVALAKSQDHRASCGVFAFGQSNAVRRWLDLRYPVTRASQSWERGLNLERGGTLKREIVWIVRCDDMAPRGIASKHKRICLTTERLCFAQTFTIRVIFYIGEKMSYFEAVAILERVKAGDKTPTLAQITEALTLTGDIEVK